MKNQLVKIVEKLESKPKWLKSRLLNFALGSTIKFVGTAGLCCNKLTQKEAIFILKNRKKVRNHIGTVHAAATALLAETASGLIVGMNIPDNKTPLLKSMNVKYIKRTTGNLKAVATITEEQVELLQQSDKGDFVIPVTVTDDAGISPVECEMVWAWVLKS
ncbi:DUF4442 domain-containing protein [Aliikangiella sp. IMCC44359]|uniref:DUF4442 domain-containing protein n=1 Tax=Aliikangiella sp. IMCC44359 TaxID=3459125 RepID=UPI00403AA20F